VTNLRNGKSVILKVNDRGPFHDNRLIDLSYAAAAKLDILAEGTGLVEVSAIDAKQYLAEQQKPRIMPSQPKVAGRTPPAAATNPSVYLQLGAFADRGNAERLRTQLADVELPGALHISETVSRQKRVYRVRVGPLDTVESADQATQILAAQGITSSQVVID
jgi:rare lipoprotein A